MRLEKLQLAAFGRFHGRSVDLGPGLNIIYGQNEAGKTTLQRFLLGMLYGFKKKSQRREFTGDAYRYRPWDGDEYRGSLLYYVDRAGRSFRVERNFDPRRDEVRIYDALTGADLSGRFQQDRRKELLFAEEHLGLTEEVFRSTAWVGQMEVGRLEIGRELLARVANMQESGREDLSVRRAIERLDEQAKEIGSERAPTRPYGRVTRLLDERQRERERAAAAREETAAREAQLSETRAALDELDAELAELNRRTDWALLRESQAKLLRAAASAEAAAAARAKADELASYAGFPVEQRESLVRTEARWLAAASEAERLGAALAALDGERADLAHRLGGWRGMSETGAHAAAEIEMLEQLAVSAEVSAPALTDEADRLREMIARLEEALEPLRPAAENGTEVLNRVESLEKEIAGLSPRGEQTGADSLRMEISRLERDLKALGGRGWLAGAILALLTGAVPSALPALFAGPALWLAVGSAALVAAGCFLMYHFTRRRAQVLEADLEEAARRLRANQERLSQVRERTIALERERDRALEGIGVGSPAELRNRVIRFEQLAARRDGQQMRLEAVEAERRRSGGEVGRRREALFGALSRALNADAETLQALPWDALVGRFRKAQGEYADLVHRAAALEREAADLSRREREQRELAARLASEIQAHCAAAGVADAAAFKAACAGRDAWEKADAEARATEALLASQLADDTMDGLRAEVGALTAQVRGDEPAALEAGAVLQARVRRLEARRAELNARRSDLAARVETALQELPDIADLDREIQALREERAGYDAELAALDLARQVIREVSDEIHREFAPKLNEAMGRIVAALTGGKYRTVRIAEDMTIRAITGDDRTVDLPALSGGTVDQFYFGLRVALLDLVTEGQERVPLILDDPFVQYDDDRMLASMACLAELSRERQVILMTCHQREVRASQGLDVPVTAIDLSAD